MSENKPKADALAATLSQEVGSPESRAAARRWLQGERPPILVSEYHEPVFDAGGNHVYGGRECDSRLALVNGKPIERLEGESLEAFKERAINEAPAMRTTHVQFVVNDGKTDAGEPPVCKISGDLAGSAYHPPGNATDAEKASGLKLVSGILSGVWGLGDTILDLPADQLAILNAQLRAVYGES